MNEATSENAPSRADTAAYRLVLAVYAMHLLTLLTIAPPLYGCPLLIGGAINRFRWQAVRGTAFEAHFAWQWDTFLKALVISAVAVALMGAARSGIQLFEVLGLGVLAGGIFWFMYRLVRGFLALKQGAPPTGSGA